MAIDAGHGGDDPGAHGVQGTEEKVITFGDSKKN
ncbi:N-acetylmuramoyl-L-alanine amidase [Methylocucumis oryzae]|nr:N-acetylmuramoyl-L-alanine amidase [Methylocucumis oryzae]